MTSKTVLIMAAGTGGHVFPALACAYEFKARGYEVHWLGTPKGMENELVTKAGFPVHQINMIGLRGKNIKTLLRVPFNLVGALWQSRKIMKQLKPVCVLGMGGFVTGPGGIAAKWAKIPLIIHEQNAVVGTANRYLSGMANRICEAFPHTFIQQDKCETTGNPVRQELFINKQLTTFTDRKMRVFVLGGSLGAEPLNCLIPEALSLLDSSIRPEVVHQTGKLHTQLTQERYQSFNVEARVEPFITDMLSVYQWADLVICRAGALTVSELAATGSAAFLIPLPHAIDDHQSYNADYLAEAGAAIKLAQGTLTPEELANKLLNIIKEPEKLVKMGHIAKTLAKPEATKRVVDICLEEAVNGK